MRVVEETDIAAKRRLAPIGLTLALLLFTLSGCQSHGQALGDDLFLDYDGEHKNVVVDCVEEIPHRIDPPAGRPMASEFADVSVVRTELDEVRTHYAVTGSLKLLYSGEDLEYRWECSVAQRFTIFRVREITYELLN